MKTQKLWKTALMLVAAVSSFQVAMAQDGQVLNSQAIDIDGYMHEQAPVSDHELESVKGELRKQQQAIIINKEKGKKYQELSRSTEKLADVTEEMIDERRDAQGEIERYNKKIDCLINQSTDPECAQFVKNSKKDEVKVQAAAPVVEAPVEESAPAKSAQKIKILPLVGMSAINGKSENLESDLSVGLRAEADISDRFSFGMGLNYMKLTTTDFGGNDYFNQNFYHDVYSPFYNAREISYSAWSLDIYSKFYIVKGDRFRPYIGGGLGYTRTSMEYEDDRALDPYNYNYSQYDYRFGDEELIASYLTAKLIGGTEISFTESIGMNIELGYSRGFGGSFNTDNSQDPWQSPDQRRLRDLNDEIKEANIFSMNIGMMIAF